MKFSTVSVVTSLNGINQVFKIDVPKTLEDAITMFGSDAVYLTYIRGILSRHREKIQRWMVDEDEREFLEGVKKGVGIE